MTLFQELNELMVNYRFRPNKKLAQIFITDEEIIQKMVAFAELKPSDTVLEIGAGTGFLTRELQKKCKTIAVELDDILFEVLQQELPQENLVLLHGNFLELEIPKFNKVVSLPPYTISSDILYKLFNSGFEKAILVFQLEFAEKLTAEPGFREYNALSVITQYFCNVRIVKKVRAKSFFPSPKANSALLELEWKKHETPVQNPQAFQAFIKSLFRFQNKNLSNALQKSFKFIEKDFGMKEKDFKEKIKEVGLKDVKVKIISCDEFVQIFNALYKK